MSLFLIFVKLVCSANNICAYYNVLKIYVSGKSSAVAAVCLCQMIVVEFIMYILACI